MKYEWRKSEKELYLPKAKPSQIKVPAFKFISISGEGNPNSRHFSDCITVLYTLSYAIKMTLKKVGDPPEAYQDYTVYPLEGDWDINATAKAKFDGSINKNDLVYAIMIRQPNFVQKSFYEEILAVTKKKKPQPLLERARFELIEEGPCIQMLHVGSYDNEAASFAKMDAYANEAGLERLSKTHKEIYLSDFRKVPVEKLKTVLRFKVKSDA
ncbi:GyrI-like domain-containing protein [uncultured Cyclobacterium sp.]|uniref:GyrI-like domain-containing protein n=1 Tax=uncultured Cyclobacterium sp. TaxID=453820 RepID=UPI0030EE5405|tara:strand:+ start:15496 stop:16131 length:636 start_codon:yes stop_codon:yes gene_type:complete